MNATRNYWPLGIIAAFVLFFIGMTSVIIIAATHRDHLVNANYYEQELRFQTQIDAGARAAAAGATMQFVPANDKLVITLPAAQLAQQFSGTVNFVRADEPKLDREFMLEPKADGVQTLDVSQLAAGPWRVRAAWTADGKTYFLEEKITLAGK